MSRANVRRPQILERKINFKNREKKENYNNSISPNNLFSKHLKRIYPIGFQKSNSSLSLSSLSLSLSENSNDSLLTDFGSPLDQKISLALRLITVPPQKKDSPVGHKSSINFANSQHNHHEIQYCHQDANEHPGDLRRCNWITNNSDKVYVAFHDECWGVPVYDDKQLFELLAMSGMLMDYNWTEILKRRELFREAFGEFDPSIVAKMGEKKITEIASNKAIMLAESRVRCIVDNAKCILKVIREFGSLSNYMWSYVNHKPLVNRYRYPRNVPMRSPKAEAISKDLVKRGFRFVGPVIVHSFMQAAGLTIDHLVDCYRHRDCINLAERPWRHI